MNTRQQTSFLEFESNFDTTDQFSTANAAAQDSLSSSTDASPMNPQSSSLPAEERSDLVAFNWQANLDEINTFSARHALSSTGSSTDMNWADLSTQQIQQVLPQGPSTETRPFAATTIDEFFIQSGASRPPVPCDYCRRLRLQCLILQTTSANPNPTKSCSSCVALFRECSLCKYTKRQPSNFETSVPVIGQLHGVSEQHSIDEQTEQWQPTQATVGQASLPMQKRRRPNSRSVRKTQPLRNWLMNNLEHPYPTKLEMSALIGESGLSSSQVTNWFSNARRRQRQYARARTDEGNRVYLSGSPRPRHLGESPMERWRNSPPEEEAPSVTALQDAVADFQAQGRDSLDASPFSWLDGADPMAYHDSDDSSNSMSSCFSYYSTLEPLFPFEPSNDSQGEEVSLATSNISRSNSSKSPTFHCTFCPRSYNKKFDWARHERSVHLPGLDSWICSAPMSPGQSCLIWSTEEDFPRCIFCGSIAPSQDHISSHEFDHCAQRPVYERTFARKDHLWQHMEKYHQCRKWTGWKPNLDILYYGQNKVPSFCGFCQASMSTWEERVDHLASHFKSGLTKKDWVGGCGINDADIFRLGPG